MRQIDVTKLEALLDHVQQELNRVESMARCINDIGTEPLALDAVLELSDLAAKNAGALANRLDIVNWPKEVAP